ncbi:PD-(D/E)XK nuclease domain-containing protein [Parapedobacter tibetensis]|uniref:PD-(D/E)XK nuclease domain-containing protein n=1 Tax=Parapedobacter tibetensis TaxID=2972951 RepID=UPI00214D4E0A|nr:PD-(D/E)XK nuclease domain-containing protein [Parapedobacter tibetensis]
MYRAAMDGTASEALQQILDRGYLAPYATDSRKKTAIGISFSSEDRQVSEYLVMEV